MNVSPFITQPIDEKDCSFLSEDFTCKHFLQSIVCLKVLQEWYNVQCINVNQFKWELTQTETPRNYVLPSIGILQIQTTDTILLHPSTKVNSIFYYHTTYPSGCLSYIWCQLCSILVQSKEYKLPSSECKQLLHSSFFASLDPLLVDCIKNGELEYINIDTLPSFDHLFQQTLAVFQSYISYVKAPLTNDAELFLKEQSQPASINKKEQLIHRCQSILQLSTHLLRKYTEKKRDKNIVSIYTYPYNERTENYIYNLFSIEPSFMEEYENVYKLWLSGLDIPFQPITFSILREYVKQYWYHTNFIAYKKEHPDTRMMPYSLSQVRSVLSNVSLEEVVGKFLFGKRRTEKQNSIVSSFCREYKEEDDLTFFLECKRYYHPSPFDRSIARIKELDQFGLWDSIQSPYLDFGGGDGQNAYAIGKKMNFKKGDVYVSDIQSWFGNQNVETYRDLCIYRYLKTYKCPFEDNMFSFITCFQVLHHIRDYMVSIKELYRICKPGGILYIREHDAHSEEVKTLIDIEHSLHEMTGQEYVNYAYLQEYFAHYFSMTELDQLLLQVGFKPLRWEAKGRQYGTDPLGPTRYYIRVWTK